jgi:hypothetical protein
VFSDRERSNLLNDVMSLARAGQLAYSTALDLTVYLPDDTDLLPWDTVRSTFDYLTGQLYSDAEFALWQVSTSEPRSSGFESRSQQDQTLNNATAMH